MRSRSSSASAFVSRPGARRASSGMRNERLRRSASTASAMPGYWTLTATSTPSWVVARWTCPMEAAAIASVSMSARTLETGWPHSLAISFSSWFHGHGRRVVAQLGHAALDALGALVLHARELDGGEHLADLHGRALHLPELDDDLLDDVGGALGLRALLRLVGAHAVQRPAAGDPAALGGDEAAEARGAPQPGGDGGVVRQRVCSESHCARSVSGRSRSPAGSLKISW